MFTFVFVILHVTMLPYAQMGLYVADRQFYLTDVAANLYRFGRLCEFFARDAFVNFC